MNHRYSLEEILHHIVLRTAFVVIRRVEISEQSDIDPFDVRMNSARINSIKRMNVATDMNVNRRTLKGEVWVHESTRSKQNG